MPTPAIPERPRWKPSTRRARRRLLACGHRAGIVVLFALGGLAGCEKTGFPDLGERVDQTLICEGPTSTWIRLAEAPGGVLYTDGSNLFAPGDVLHELVLLAAPDPMAPPSAGCFNTFQVGPPGAVATGALFLRQGEFTSVSSGMPGDPELAVTEVIEFVFKPAPELSVLQRTGSARRAVEPIRERSLTLRMEGEELVITEGGVDARYRNLNLLVGEVLLDPAIALDERSRLVGNFFNLVMLTTQSRMLGFGGAGMTQYMGDQGSEFASLTGGAFHVVVGGQLILNNIVTTIDFREAAEYTGMVLDGPQVTEVTAGGDGSMHGAVHYSFQLDPDDPFQVYAGEVDFAGVQVVDGYGDGGTATVVHPDATRVDVPTSAVTAVDLTPYL